MRTSTTILRTALTIATAFALSTTPASAAGTIGHGPSEPPIFSAIREGVTAQVRLMALNPATVNSLNSSQETPLMYAALYGDAKTVQLLLQGGADPNAKSSTKTTALMLAVADIHKVELLVQHGADVNARSVTGRTPLLIAAARAGSGTVVNYLIRHGANVNIKDDLKGIPMIPAGGGGSTPLIEAAKIRDGQALRCLLARGAEVQTKDNTGADALAAAALNGNTENVQLLLRTGATIKARVAMGQLTPLIFAAWRQDAVMAKALLAAGADPNVEDASGSTAVMWSAYNDYADTGTTEVLIAGGVDVNHRNRAGETALTFARKRGDTPVVRLLLAKGAVGAGSPRPVSATAAGIVPLDVHEAVRKSVALLQKSGPQFGKVSGCMSCHNQSLPQMVTAMARARAIPVDEQIADQQRKFVLGNIKPARLPLIEMSDVVPDIATTAGYLMLGLAAEGYEPDAVTDAVALNLAAKQNLDGSWRPWAPRPPLEFSAVTSTALSARVLQVYAPPARRAEFDARIAAAANWLRQASPRTNEEKVMRLLGLVWAKAAKTEIDGAARTLAADQRADGGWSQLATLESDAYATGQALYALRQANTLAPSDSMYRRGADYLLRTQNEDGSWHVASRAFPFQPYNESGYPHGKDQWISASGASWATMALMLQ